MVSRDAGHFPLIRCGFRKLLAEQKRLLSVMYPPRASGFLLNDLESSEAGRRASFFQLPAIVHPFFAPWRAYEFVF